MHLEEIGDYGANFLAVLELWSRGSLLDVSALQDPDSI